MFLNVCTCLNNPLILLLLLCVLPVAGGFIALLPKGKSKNAIRMAAALLFGALELFFALSLYLGGGAQGSLAFAGQGMEMRFVVSGLASLLLLFTAFMFLIVSTYAASWFRKKEKGGTYLFFLFISLGMVNGALISDNLAVVLFFWEGLLCSLFGIMLINPGNPKTALKALALSGTADLLLMLGIVTTAHLAGSANMSDITRLSTQGLGTLGCVCMLLGAMGKAGAMPFHSWIPDAADDAPAPFLAAFPGSLEKIAGIYLLTRIVTNLYDIRPGSNMSIFVMSVGAVTLFFGVAMALIQKDMKRLLSYHAISQVGYMILGIGTGFSVGIVGGIFHMMNHVLYKSGLFITAGAIEDQTGTTDLHKIGGIWRLMPGTTVVFIICALSIAGFPGFNGFFSKELIFDAALRSSTVFYIMALAGAFMTAASFLKLGGAAFFGELHLPSGHKDVNEVSAGILAPAAVLAAMCIFFGVFNIFPLQSLIGPAIGDLTEHAGWPESTMLVLISCAVLALALFDHLYGKRRDGSALAAANHIHYAPGIRQCYALAEKGYLDPYYWMTSAIATFSTLCQWIENGVSWVYDTGIPKLVTGSATALHRFWNGSISRYLIIALVGVACILLIFLAVML